MLSCQVWKRFKISRGFNMATFNTGLTFLFNSLTVFKHLFISQAISRWPSAEVAGLIRPSVDYITFICIAHFHRRFVEIWSKPSIDKRLSRGNPSKKLEIGT